MFCAIVLGAYIFARKHYPCPEEPHIFGTNHGVISRVGDRCLVWLPSSEASIPARSAFFSVASSKYIVMTQPILYIGRLSAIESHEDEANGSEFVLNQTYFQIYLTKLSLNGIEAQSELVSSKLRRLETLNLSSESRFRSRSREELSLFRNNLKTLTDLITELEQTERSIEAFLRIQSGGRGLLSLKTFQDRVTYPESPRELVAKLREIRRILNDF